MSFKERSSSETDPWSFRFYDYWFKVKGNGTIEFDGDIP